MTLVAATGIEEISREVRFRGTSRLTVKLVEPQSEAYGRVRSLFAAVRHEDERAGTIRGRILGLKRPVLKLAQEVAATFTSRAADHSLVVFQIDIRFVGRAMDSKVFDDIVQRLKDPTAPTIAIDWMTQQMAKGRYLSDVLVLPVAAAAIASPLALYIIAPMGSAAFRNGNYSLGGVFNGLFLSDAFLLGPILIAIATVTCVKTLLRRRSWQGIVGALLTAVGAYSWIDTITSILRSRP